jgi:hypothetical protein
VLSMSFDSSKLWISVWPIDIAPIISDLWDIDLSPLILSEPFNLYFPCIVNFRT